jgi:hypothetical protein
MSGAHLNRLVTGADAFFGDQAWDSRRDRWVIAANLMFALTAATALALPREVS